jgi:hypothetical protein
MKSLATFKIGMIMTRTRQQFVLIIVSLLSAALFGIILSVGTKDWTWFARSGSVMVVVSLVSFGFSFIATTRETISKKKIEQVNLSITYYQIALYGGIIGTIIWGFGDLVGEWF